jgi:hypothetical protein
MLKELVSRRQRRALMVAGSIRLPEMTFGHWPTCSRRGECRTTRSLSQKKKTTLRAGLKTFPVEIGLDEVKSDLLDQGLALLKVSE